MRVPSEISRIGLILLCAAAVWTSGCFSRRTPAPSIGKTVPLRPPVVPPPAGGELLTPPEIPVEASEPPELATIRSVPPRPRVTPPLQRSPDDHPASGTAFFSTVTASTLRLDSFSVSPHILTRGKAGQRVYVASTNYRHRTAGETRGSVEHDPKRPCADRGRNGLFSFFSQLFERSMRFARRAAADDGNLSGSDRSMTVSDLHKIFTNIERRAHAFCDCGSRRTCNYFPTVLKTKSGTRRSRAFGVG